MRHAAARLVIALTLVSASAAIPTPASAADVTVEVSNNVFTPREVTIAPGDRVIWRNVAGVHNAVSDTNVFSSGPPSSDAWEFRFTFQNAGRFPYYCEVHGSPNGFGMSGVVTVVGAQQNGQLALAAASTTVAEGAGQVRLTVRRLGGSDGAVSVSFATANGTAQAGLDYTQSNGTLSWGAGDSADKTITVPILQDTATESNETFTVTLSQPTGGATLANPSSATVTITDDDGATGPCVKDANTLCLLGNRFSVQLDWVNQFDGSSGRGGAIDSTDFAGYFWFTTPDNIEVILKILEFEDSFKFFYGQLTNLQFQLTVTDTQTGAVRLYGNGPNDCGNIDQVAFPKSRKKLDKLVRWRVQKGHGKSGTCVPSGERLCLLDNRFSVEVVWRNQFNGASGAGGAAPISNLTGTFFFDDPRNVELLTKALDFGNDRILFIYGPLSDLEYTITFTDTLSGQSKQYHNPPGTFCGGLDNDAF